MHIALAALLAGDRQQRRLRAGRCESFAQSRHAVEEPAISGIQPRYDVGGAEPDSQDLRRPAGLVAARERGRKTPAR
jgi:hypothetical protein